MNLGFSKIIDRIHAEIAPQYWSGAIQWADENHSNAWTNAINRFDSALSSSLKILNSEHLKIESEIYRDTLIGLLKNYKEAHQKNEAFSFLESIQSKSGE